jgi:predicted Zn-dependent protease
MLARLLAASNAPGAAREVLRSLISRGGGSAEAMVELAQLEINLQDVRGAIEAAEKAVALDPGNRALVEFRDGVRQFADGATVTDEFIAAVRKIQEIMNQRSPDRAGALKLAKETAARAKDARQKAVMVQMLFQLQDRDAAKALLDKSLAEHPEAAPLVQLNRLFEKPRTREDILKAIEDQKLDPLQNALTG